MLTLFWHKTPSFRRFVLATAAIAALIGSCVQESVSQTPSSDLSSKPSPLPVSKRDAQKADDAYLAGLRALDQHHYAEAESQFQRAAQLSPFRPDYVQAAALAREHQATELVQQAGQARMSGQPKKADALLAQAHALDPENNIVNQHMDSADSSAAFHSEIEPLRSDTVGTTTLAGPITLAPTSGQHTFHLRGDSHQVLQQLFSPYGIRTVVDDSLEHQSLRVDLEDASYAQASNVILDLAHAFATPLDSHTLIIAKDTAENRARYERQLQETIYVPGFAPDQMRELGTLIQNVFDVKKTSIQSNGGNIVIRAPEDTLSALNLILSDLIDGSAEVVLDINLYMVDRTRQRNVGAQLPQQLGVYNVESAARDLVNANQSLVNQAIAQGLIPANANDITIALALISSGLVQSSLLANTIGFFGGGLTMTGVTTNASTTFQLALSSSDTRALDSIKLRLGDRQEGNFRSGTRYPIVTSTYTTGSAATPSSLAGVTINGVSAQSLLNQSSTVTIPQIQFEDLGLILKAKPTLQRGGEITIQLDLKVQALGGGSLNNLPILNNRQYVSTITMRDGESTLLASSLSRTESAAISGLPLLSELPGFQTATADKTTETDTSELVLLITPHIVRHRKNTTAGPRIAFEQRLPD
jgi:Flp pilus assembly secretin CpaC